MVSGGLKRRETKLAGLVVDAGELAPPVAVYWDVDNEQASLTAPPGRGGSQ
jgi:hypothetical protein